jgi:hypothetical protein
LRAGSPGESFAVPARAAVPGTAPVPTPPPPRTPRRLASLAAAAAAAAIAVATLTPGDPHALEDTGLTCLVCGSRGGVDVTLNLLLFLPLGAALAAAGWRGWTAVLAGAALSLAVETAQLTIVVGRDPSLSDLVFNTVGTGLGWLVVRHARAWALPAPVAARWLAAAALGVWTLALVLTAAGLRLDVSTSRYAVSRLPAGTAFLRPFEGEVREAWLDGRPVSPVEVDGYAPMEEGPPLRGDSVVVAAVVEPAYPPGMLRPLVVVYDEAMDELLVFGQRGRSLVLRVRTASAAARFASPALELPDVFPPRDPTGRLGAPVRVAGRVTPRALVLHAARGDTVRTATLARSPLVGWSFVTASYVRYGRWGDAVTALWTVLLVIPGGYGARRAAGAGPPRPIVARAALLAAAYAAPLLAIPRAFPVADAPAHGWAALAAGLAAGWFLGAWTLRRRARAAV